MDDTSNFGQLDAKLSYLNNDQRSLVERAYCFASAQHDGQLRASGEDYIVHPLQVALIVADMFCDSATIVVALLHDVLEDTDTDYQELVYNFGEEIANLVDGLTKLSKFKFLSQKEKQAKNFSKTFLAISQDIRIIIVKLADRLHNMRTLGGLNLKKRKRIAKETLDIYAPIAGHLGLYKIRRELEFLAFVVLFPLKCKTLEKESNKLITGFLSTKIRIEKQLSDILSKNCVLNDFSVQQEIRSIYEIHIRMTHNHNFLEENLNLANFRIVLNDKEDCYRILGRIHNAFKPIPGKFKDYIAIPKVNGYRALHTSVLGEDGTIINLMICNKTMEKIALYGIASCWMFNKKDDFHCAVYSAAKDWIINLLKFQNYNGNSKEFFDNVRENLYSDKIYVFTPKGKIVVLARGSIVLDFAYALRRDIGNTCVAAEVNHRLVDIFTVLENGMVVKIITNSHVTPDPRWLSLVRTNLARHKIKLFLSKLTDGSLIELGKKLLSEILEKFGYSLNDFSKEFYDKIGISIKSVFRNIGKGNLFPMVVGYQLINLSKGCVSEKKVLSNISNIPLKFSRCCHPIPGDKIGGYFTSNFGIDVHSYYCPVFKRLWHNNPQLVLNVNWESERIDGEFHAIVSFEILNQDGYLKLVSKIVQEQQGEIKKIFYSKEYLEGYILVTLGILVKNVAHLEKIIMKLEQIPTVEEVIRKNHYYG